MAAFCIPWNWVNSSDMKQSCSRVLYILGTLASFYYTYRVTFLSQTVHRFSIWPLIFWKLKVLSFSTGWWWKRATFGFISEYKLRKGSFHVKKRFLTCFGWQSLLSHQSDNKFLQLLAPIQWWQRTAYKKKCEPILFLKYYATLFQCIGRTKSITLIIL